MNDINEQLRKSAKAYPYHAIAFIIFVLTFAILPSVNSEKNKATNSYLENKALVNWLETNKAALTRNSSSSNTTDLSINDITSITQRNNITIDRIQPKTNGDIFITINNTDYENAIKLIDALEAHSVNTNISTLTLNRGKRNGEINVSATITKF